MRNLLIWSIILSVLSIIVLIIDGPTILWATAIIMSSIYFVGYTVLKALGVSE